jgi:folate-binding protein YgfZ
MERVRIDQQALDALRRGTATARSPAAVFVLRGPGTVQCLQGIFTNDVVKPGDHALVFGAFLTPKGMIVADGWVFRLPDRTLVITSPAAREPLEQIFQKSLPPRLARVDPVGAEYGVLWTMGPRAADLGTTLGLAVPERPGSVAPLGPGPGAPIAGRPAQAAAFGMLFLGVPAALDPIEAAFRGAGAIAGGDTALAAAHILTGWPRLGIEIGERTLPQEVRFEALGGVSFTKGCYTGQETVARLHFRGHTNRDLRGLEWDAPEAPTDDLVLTSDGREIGILTSVLDTPSGQLGLGLIRREVPDGATVVAGGSPATVVSLPFHPGATAA